MKKSLVSIVALMFALTLGVAQAAKHMAEEGKKKEDPTAVACKGKKAGDEVMVDGKKMKCPAPPKKKTEAKKEEPKK